MENLCTKVQYRLHEPIFRLKAPVTYGTDIVTAEENSNSTKAPTGPLRQHFMLVFAIVLPMARRATYLTAIWLPVWQF